VGATHGIGNVFVLGIYWMSFYMRIGASETPPIAAIVLSIAGVLLATVTGWLGGELVNRLSVGVDDGANVNAPSSLTGPAQGREPDRRMAAD
jgi:uncharacterized membrane protein